MKEIILEIGKPLEKLHRVRNDNKIDERRYQKVGGDTAIIRVRELVPSILKSTGKSRRLVIGILIR